MKKIYYFFQPQKFNRKSSIFNSQYSRGFTFIELLIVIGVTIVLFGFIGFNLIKAQGSTNLQSSVSTLVSDIRSQQLKAMEGATESRSVSDDYSIYFQNGSYTLFHGDTYFPSPSDNSNFIVNTKGVAISTTFPNGLLIFQKTSGEVLGWNQSENTIKLTNIGDGNSETLTINKYGVITSIQ